VNKRRRVHVSFYYDTTSERIDSRPDYRESIRASLLEAIEQHANPKFARRIKKVEVRLRGVK